MQLNPHPFFSEDIPTQVRQLTDLWRDVSILVNQLANGNIAGTNNAQNVAPTGAGALGDIVRNSAPAILGAAGSQYVLYGWICTTASSTAATWTQMRIPTGT